MPRDCPSPTYYKLNRLFDLELTSTISKKSGRDTNNYCSFGIPFSYYERVMVADGNNKGHRANSGSCSPGPGAYT